MAIPPHAQVITDWDALASTVQGLYACPAIALDTESDSFHRYPQQLCLIQIAAPDTVAIVDPIALPDVEPLRDLLASRSIQKVIHAAAYDVWSLDRAWGFRIANIYDTSIAARFVGIGQVGLAVLAETLLSVSLNKDKRLQRADWGQRPLSQEALDYAASDVLHLLDIRDRLAEKVASLGRSAWVAEECARLEDIRYTPPDPKTAFLGVKGSWGLSPRALAILSALFDRREREAVRQARPPFHILPDETLVYLATHPDAGVEDVPGARPWVLRRYRRMLEAALREGQAAPPFRRPVPAGPRQERPTPEQNERLQKLKTWRNELSEKMSLESSLLWPTPSLERLALQPDTLDIEMRAPDVRAWQRTELGDSLRDALCHI